MKQHIFKDKMSILLFLFTVCSILVMSIGYAALNTDLSISGDAYVRVDEDIRITDLKMIEATNGAYEIYNSKYSKDSTSMFVALPNSNSAITYEVTVVNNSSIKYQLKDIIETSFTNKNVNYEIIGLSIDEIILKNTTMKFQVKFMTNLVNQETNVLLNYVFQEFTSMVIAERDADITGDYHVVTKNPADTNFVYWGNGVFYDKNLSIISASYQNNRIAVFSNKRIDLTKIDTLVFEIDSFTNHFQLSSTTYFGVMGTSSAFDIDENKFTRVEAVVQLGTTNTRRVVSVDVSDLTGEYYIKMLEIHGGEVEAYSVYTVIRSIYLK